MMLSELVPMRASYFVKNAYNALEVIAVFRKNARRHTDNSSDEVSKVVDKAMSGDYDNLLSVIEENSYLVD